MRRWLETARELDVVECGRKWYAVLKALDDGCGTNRSAACRREFRNQRAAMGKNGLCR